MMPSRYFLFQSFSHWPNDRVGSIWSEALINNSFHFLNCCLNTAWVVRVETDSPKLAVECLKRFLRICKIPGKGIKSANLYHGVSFSDEWV